MALAVQVRLLFIVVLALAPSSVLAWGGEGHAIIALIANQFLDAGVRVKVVGILSTDTDDLAGHDIASASTWADRYRDSDRHGSQERYRGTREWHFVDIEIDDPDLSRACFERPPLPAGLLASRGPAHACIVDKIDQFAAELADPATDAEERLIALKFLLHLVGDLHQPLHAADDHDAGGNGKRISAGGLGAENLHQLWDVELVEQLGNDPQSAAPDLIGRIFDEERQEWSQGTAADWAMESFEVARDRVYGQLPLPGADRAYTLLPAYIGQETRDAARQMSKAGVRLALVLNSALGGEQKNH